MRRTAFDWLLEAIALAALAVTITLAAATWPALPGEIPTHFGPSGNPDDWGPKSRLWLLPAIAAGNFLLLTFASRYQNLINIPFTIDRSDPRIQQILLSMSIALKAGTALLFALLVWSQINVALGRQQGLGRGFLPIALALALAPLAWYSWKLYRVQ